MSKDLFGKCPYVTAQKTLSGKWSIYILHILDEAGAIRFNELQRRMPENMTHTTLSRQLKMLEEDGFDSDLKEMGHMYLFGDREEGFTVHSIYENMKEEYSPETVDFMFERYFEYYYHLDIIDNGLYDCYDIDYVEKAQMDADRIHAELGYVEGSNILLEQLVSGNWDEKFAVYQPGEQITQSSFYEKSW